MRLLLINKNPVVSRMMQMSVPKAGFEIEECDSVYNLPSGHYEVVVIDDEMYDENFMQAIKQQITYKQLGLITATKAYAADLFDFILSKPFLPTDLIEILRKVRSSLQKDNRSSPQQNLQQESDPFDAFLQQPPQQQTDAPERIVEIEDLVEESPIVDEVHEKGDVLDKREIETVAKLLDETEEKGEISLDDLLDVTPQEFEDKEMPRKIRPISLLEDEKKEEVIRQPEPIVLQDELELGDMHEDTEKETLALVEEEHKKEEITVQQEKILQDGVQKDSSSFASSSLSHVNSPKEQEDKSLIDEKIQKEEVQKEIQGLVQRMDVQTLREVLNGMRIDITIQISYPEQ